MDILEAARALFADLGFERTTMRAVAAHADVDVALIYHHFGNKDDLLAAALTPPERAQPYLVAIPAGTRSPGRAVASAIVGMWEHDPALRAALIGAHLSGLLQARYLFKVRALAATDPALLIDAAAPLIEHYLTGDLSA